MMMIWPAADIKRMSHCEARSAPFEAGDSPAVSALSQYAVPPPQ